MQPSINPQHIERRHYCRISTVFPVIFSVYKNPNEPLKRLQGFTRDISEDGICLELNEILANKFILIACHNLADLYKYRSITIWNTVLIFF